MSIKVVYLKKKFTLFITMLMITAMLSGLIMNVSPNVGAISLSTNIKVNDDSYTGLKTNIDVTVLDSGRIISTWSEERGGNKNVYISYSSNNGTSFTDDKTVNLNTNGNQIMPALANGGGDDVYVVWQDSYQDDHVFISRSMDGGKSFEEPQEVANMSNSIQNWPSVAANGDNVAVSWIDAGSDNTIKIWDPTNGDLLETLDGHTGAVRGLGYSPDGDILASGSEDSSIIVWDTTTWTEIDSIYNHRDIVTDIAWYSDGSRFVSTSWDGSVKIWDPVTLDELDDLDEVGGIMIDNPANAVDISDDMGHIAVGYNGKENPNSFSDGLPDEYYNVTVWDTGDWSSFTVNEKSGGGDSSSIMDVKFSHDDGLIATASNNVKVWNPTNGSLEYDFDVGISKVNSVAWSPDDIFIAAGLTNNSILVFNHTNYTDQFWLEGHEGSVNDLQWNEVTDQLASVASEPNARIWDTDSTMNLVNLSGHRNTVYSLDWSQTNGEIATAGGNSRMKGLLESQIFCAYSSDGGQTFSDPIIVSDTLKGSKNSPDIVMDANNGTHIVWSDDRTGNEGIYYANSTDNGASFSMDIDISVTNKVENTPALDVERDTGIVHITWQKGTGGDNSNPIYDIHYSNSSDGFSNVKIIDGTTAVQQASDIAVTPDGGIIYVTWIDSRLGGYQVFLYSSSDGGSTFTGYDVVNDESTQSKNFPAIACNVYGDVSLVWRDYREVGINIYHSGSVVSDTYNPIITSATPLDGSIDVSIFKSIYIEFSEPMDRASVENTFSLTDGNRTFNVNDFFITWSDYDDEIRLSPLTPLLYSTTYTATLDNGPKDISDNVMDGDYSWSFSTGIDTDAPVIQLQLVIEVSDMLFTIMQNGTFDVNYDETVTISAEIKDYNGKIDETKLYYKGVGESTYSALNMENNTDLNNDRYSATIPAQNALGNVSLYIWASDVIGNTGNTTLYSFKVKDMKMPEIVMPNITEQPVGQTVSIDVEVTDFSAIQNVAMIYWESSAPFAKEMNLSFDPVARNYQAVIPQQDNIGVITYNISATDTHGNKNDSSLRSINIIDDIKPVIVLKDAEILEDKSIRISATVTDNVDLDEVSLYFKAVGGDLWVKRSMSNNETSDDEYSFTIPAQTKSGTVYYYINATDTSGNSASTLDDIQDLAHELPVVGTETPWLLYLIPIIILVGVISAAWFLKGRRSKPAGDDEDLGDDDGDDDDDEVPHIEEDASNDKPEQIEEIESSKQVEETDITQNEPVDEK